MAQTFHRDRFTWLAYLFLAFYGYLLNVLGPITPFLKDELDLSYTVSSLHFTAFAAGILLVGLGGHWLIQRIGRWRSLWIGALGMSLGALLLVTGRTPVITIGASFLMGLIGSLILVIVPVALSDQHGELRAVALSEANVISTLAAATAPLMIGLFARFSGGWRMALGIVAFTPLLLYWGLGKTPSPTTPAGWAAAAAQPDQTHTKQPLPSLFWVYWLALVLAVSAEFCMISWSADYLENVLGMLKADAAQAVSLFFAGMILGRMAGSRLVQRFPTSQVISVSILLAGLGFMLFWKSGGVFLGLSGLFLTGLGIATLYPLILSLAIGTTSDTVQASARATLASGTAILTLPLVLGRLADAVGIGAAYGVVALLLVGAFLIVQVAGRR
ncbi:MAG: MFS transporter [Thermoflexales bacterium]|nr:MFS transporter [Thermoflexales bacterium]